MKTRILATWVFGLGWILALGGNAAGQEAPVPSLPIPTATAKPAKAPLSGWALEVAKLIQAGVEDKVTLTFITNSAGTFNLGSDQIITLHQLGIGNEVIQAMLAHDQEIATGERDVFATTAPLPTQVLPIVLVPTTTKADTAAPQVGASSTSSPPDPPPSTSLVAEQSPATELAAITVAIEPSQAIAQPATYCIKHRPSFYEIDELYPVREPNPVQLTAPIIVWRGTGRVPNTMVLEMLH
jgi:hypothetical protein